MIKNLSPILIAENLDETIAFYHEKLSFEIDFVFNEPGLDGYARLFRDNVSINFRQGKPPGIPSSFGGVSIEVDDVDLFYQNLVNNKTLSKDFPRMFSHITEHPPEDKEYGVRDMFLVDPNGYIITILSPL